MANLSDTRTALRGAIRGLDVAAGAAAPVSAQLGSLVDGAAATLGSLDAARDGLGATLDRAPAADARRQRPTCTRCRRCSPTRRGWPAAYARAPHCSRGRLAAWPTRRRPAPRCCAARPGWARTSSSCCARWGRSRRTRRRAARSCGSRRSSPRSGRTLRFTNPVPDAVQLPRALDAQRLVHDLRGRRERHLVPLHPRRSRPTSSCSAPRRHRSCTRRRTATAPANECETGNEPLRARPAHRPPGRAAANHTELTAPPAGTPEGPR